MNEMKMLLWKDCRLSRIPILAGVIGIVFPYLFLFIRGVTLKDAWLMSVFAPQFAMAILAGNIIACERADRSAEFLAFQGASRKMIIASKLTLCMVVFMLICIIPFIVSTVMPSINNPKQPELGLIQIQAFAAVVGIGFFGCGWLMSSLLSSYGLAVFLGFLVPYLSALTVNLILFSCDWKDDYASGKIMIGVIFFLGLISLAAGTLYFIRSKEA